MNSFSDKLLRLKNELKIEKDKEIAEILGIKPTTFNSQKKAGKNFPETELFALAAKRPELNLNVNYILTGTRKVGEKAKVLNEIGGRIQEERLANEYGLAEFAKRLNVTEELQQQIEANEATPDMDYLISLAALRFDLSYILHGTTSERPKNSLTAGGIAITEALKTAKNSDEFNLLIAYRSANELGKVALKSVAEAVRNDEAYI